MNLREEWRDINYYSNYEISNFGRARNKTNDKILKSSTALNGYKIITLWKNKHHKTFYIHHLVMNEFTENNNHLPCIDHIDKNKLNNQLSNLRRCTHQDNLRNRTKTKSATTSRYLGVSKSGKKWKSYCHIDGKQINLGLYDDEKDAAIAYNNFALSHFGEFAGLNKIDEI